LFFTDVRARTLIDPETPPDGADRTRLNTSLHDLFLCKGDL
jgi:hypothetical protein